MGTSPQLALTRQRYWCSSAPRYIARTFRTSGAWCFRSFQNLATIQWENLGGKRKPSIREQWVSNLMAGKITGRTQIRMKSCLSKRRPECWKKESINRTWTITDGLGSNEERESYMARRYNWCTSTPVCIFNTARSLPSAIGNASRWSLRTIHQLKGYAS